MKERNKKEDYIIKVLLLSLIFSGGMGFIFGLIFNFLPGVLFIIPSLGLIFSVPIWWNNIGK